MRFTYSAALLVAATQASDFEFQQIYDDAYQNDTPSYQSQGYGQQQYYAPQQSYEQPQQSYQQSY